MIVVAGHLCLDVIPRLERGAPLEPGGLTEVGPAALTPGGAVANTGLALARLGLAPRLVGRVGDDAFGAALRGALAERAPDAELELLAEEDASTSYSVVISRPGGDRSFLHHPGCNDAFEAADLLRPPLPEADLLHLGYPPLMPRLYADGGAALAGALAELRARGVTVSLDMAMPDPEGPSGRVDWRAFLTRVLPQVDLFAPSWGEIRAMLRPGEPAPLPDGEAVRETALELVALGPAAVAIKLGERGLFLASADAERVAAAGRAAPPADWAGRRLWAPAFAAEVRGTTGAGDVAVAGLLTALVRHRSVLEALDLATAAGACAVEGVDALEALPPLAEIDARLAAGWERAPVGAPDWRPCGESGVLAAPDDPCA